MGLLPGFSGVLRVAAGAIQCAGHGAGQFKVFCGHAHPGRSGRGGFASTWLQKPFAGLALVGGVVFDGRLPGRADDQHGALLQLQGYSVDAQAAIAGNSPVVPYGCAGVAVFGVYADFAGLYLCDCGRGVARSAFFAASHGFEAGLRFPSGSE